MALKNLSGITLCDFIKVILFSTYYDFKRSGSDNFTAKTFCLYRILKTKLKIFDIFGYIFLELDCI